jgi:hypothetical protein
MGRTQKLLVILAGLASLGCGIIPVNPEVAPEFSILYSQFLTDANHYNRELDLDGLIVRFGPTEPTVAGYCSGNKLIVINEESWNSYDRYGKEVLLYHEFGHCLLGQDHRLNSIMSPTLIRSYYYAAHADTFKQELFTYEDN